MKRNYQYLQGGGNLPQKKLPKLDDSEIEKLYKYYSSKDKFHSKFKGTKREYCSAVAGLIENFYQKQNLDKVIPHLTGKGRFNTETIKNFVRITPDGLVSTKKELSDFNVYTPGEFTPRGNISIFSRQTRRDKPDENLLTVDQLIKHGNDYEEVITKFFSKDIATANFLLAAKFDQITDLTPEGYQQRIDLASAYSKTFIRSTYDKYEYKWTDVDEATFRSEYIYAKSILSGKPGFESWTDEYFRFSCIQKLFSQEATYNVLDFETPHVLFECKGNIVARKDDFKAQVDTKKIAEIILTAFDDGKGGTRTNPRFGNVSFMRFTGNDKLNKLILTPKNIEGSESKAGEISKDSDVGIPVESIINLNVTKMLQSEQGKIALGRLKTSIEKYAAEPTPFKKTLITKSPTVDDAVFDLVLSYFGLPKKQVGNIKQSAKETITSLSIDFSEAAVYSKLELYAVNSSYTLKENTVKGLVEFIQDETNKETVTRFKDLGSDELIVTMPNIFDAPLPEIPLPEEISGFKGEVTLKLEKTHFARIFERWLNLPENKSIKDKLTSLKDGKIKTTKEFLKIVAKEKGKTLRGTSEEQLENLLTDLGIKEDYVPEPPKEYKSKIKVEPIVTEEDKKFFRTTAGVKKITSKKIKEYLDEDGVPYGDTDTTDTLLKKWIDLKKPKESSELQNTIVSEEESEEEKRKKEITKKLSSAETVTEDEYRELAFLFGYTNAKDPEVKLENVKKSLLNDKEYKEFLIENLPKD